MKKVNDYEVKTFRFDEKYLVDVVVTGETYEAWLFREDCAIKDFMYGLLKSNIDYDAFIELVEVNLNFNNYIDFYERNYGE